MSNIVEALNNNEDFMLSTYDNNWNPFTNFEDWFKEDMLLRHNSCGLLSMRSFDDCCESEELNEKRINKIKFKSSFKYIIICCVNIISIYCVERKLLFSSSYNRIKCSKYCCFCLFYSQI